jgi:hypothetical protein
MNKNSHRPKGVAISVYVFFCNGDLMVGFDQVNFYKNSAPGHAVIERLHVWEGVPVGYGDLR